MSTRIHKKVLLAAPLIAVAESVTRIPPDGEFTITSRHGMLLYFLAGKAMLKLGDAPPAQIQEGSVVIAPGPSQRVYSSAGDTSTPLHYYGISFFRHSPRRQRAHRHEKELAEMIKKAFQRPAILTDGGDANLRQRLVALRHAFDDDNTGASVLLYTAVLDVCVETVRLVLSRQSWKKIGPGRRNGRALVNASLEYMLRNLKQNPNVENVAWSAKVTAEHLCRVFRKELGMTPRSALRKMQIDSAKSLLINSPMDIHRIAGQTGFASATSFGRCFKTLVGVTPTEYRARNVGTFVHRAFP
jgi:AraC-like DNA-binding protein